MSNGAKRPPLAEFARHGARAAKAVNPMAVVTEALDYMKVRTQEHTKREYIRAKRDVLLAALQNEREIILSYFAQRFSERHASLQQFYALLERATDSGRIDELQVALTGILGILQDNPLKDLVEFRRNMADPEFKLEL